MANVPGAPVSSSAASLDLET
ncbi:hypothetical protein, partial [Azospirillum melinis]